MPRRRNSVPRYCKHKASGQAIATLNGRDHYLGPHGTQAPKREQDRVISEWTAAGRTPPQCAIKVIELVARYGTWAKGYCRRNGKPTETLPGVKPARVVRPHSLWEYGRAQVFFRFNVTLAKGDGFSDLSTLSIVQDQVSLARSYAKVL